MQAITLFMTQSTKENIENEDNKRQILLTKLNAEMKFNAIMGISLIASSLVIFFVNIYIYTYLLTNDYIKAYINTVLETFAIIFAGYGIRYLGKAHGNKKQFRKLIT